MHTESHRRLIQTPYPPALPILWALEQRATRSPVVWHQPHTSMPHIEFRSDLLPLPPRNVDLHTQNHPVLINYPFGSIGVSKSSQQNMFYSLTLLISNHPIASHTHRQKPLSPLYCKSRLLSPQLHHTSIERLK